MNKNKILAILVVLVLFLYGCGGEPASLSDNYNCDERKCEYRGKEGMIYVEELKHNYDLVEWEIEPVNFKKYSDALQYVSRCKEECLELKYNLYSYDFNKVVFRFTGETGYSVTCLCSEYVQ